MAAGRPTKRTPKVEAMLARALRAGLSRHRAALVADITYEDLKSWCRNDEEFSTYLNAQESIGHLDHAEYLRLGIHPDADGNRQQLDSAQVAASKFYLSTRRDEAWVTHQKTEHTGNLSFTDAVAAMEDSIPEDSE